MDPQTAYWWGQHAYLVIGGVGALGLTWEVIRVRRILARRRAERERAAAAAAASQAVRR